MRPKFLAYGFHLEELARVCRVFSGPARFPKPLTRNLNLVTPTSNDPNGPGLPESCRAVSRVRTGLGRVPARAGSKDRAAWPSGLAAAQKDDRHRSEARCQGPLSLFPGLFTSRWAASRLAPERVGSRLAHVQCNRSPTGQPSTWAGTGDRCFPGGRQAKGVEPVGPGGSIRKRSFIFNHLEFPEKPLDLEWGEGGRIEAMVPEQ